MKKIIALLPVLLALTSVPSVARAVGETPAAAATTRVELRTRFNAMVDELAAKAAARKATREDFSRVVEEMRSVANEYMESVRVAGIREKAITRMNELELKAKDASLLLMEFDAFKDLLIDLDLQGIFQRTIERARAGDVTRLQWYPFTGRPRLEDVKLVDPSWNSGKNRRECADPLIE